MADTLVYTNVDATQDRRGGAFGPYWIDVDNAIIVYADGVDNPSFAKTTDAGASWTDVQIVSGVMTAMDCWFDQETPGNTGTIVHLAWLDSTANAAYYVDIDISDFSVGTIRTIDAGITVALNPTTGRIAITKTVSGNLIVALSTQTEVEAYKSANQFATAATAITDPLETGTEEDWLLLYPANTADNNDAAGIFWDRSASEISVKMYDDSANTWTESSVSGSMTFSLNWRNMDAAVRHSDGALLLAAHSAHDTATDDLKTWEIIPNSIAAPTITAKTDVVTDEAEAATVGVFINQQNDDVYISYLHGTWLSLTDVYFKKSTNGMTNWGVETSYSETQDDNRCPSAGRTVGDSGGRYQPQFYNDDISAVYVNLVNDIIIPAFVGGVVLQPYTYSDSFISITNIL